MDAGRFDGLVRTVAGRISRRSMLGILGALPLLDGLATVAGGDEVVASGRRKRRKKRHKHGSRAGNRAGNNKKPRCQPDSKSLTCQGTCGPATNNCRKTVNCGSCDCTEPCDPCFTCQSGASAPGQCVLDPEQRGETCGSDGQICQTDGACACDAGSCANPTPICVTGACQICGTDTECRDANLGDLCCSGSCVSGVCCEDDSCTGDEAPDCVGHLCVCAGADDTACDGGKVCCDDGCADLDTNHGHCGSCDNACRADQLCLDGGCVDCDVTCPGGDCDGADLLEALNQGGTVYICPGRYSGFFSLTANVTAIGSGQGDNETVDTILNATGTIVVRNNVGNRATLRRLRVTGARGNLAGGVETLENASLDMVDCTVTDNISVDSGGPGVYNERGVLTMTGCTITDNHANGSGYLYGGGIWNLGTMTLTDCDIDGNSAQLGGGVFNSERSTATMASCHLTYNEAGIGGGIYNYPGGRATLTGCIVEFNKASLVGGGIGNTSGAIVVLDATSVTQNRAGVDGGGGIYNEDQVTLQNGATVTNNEPDNCTGVPIDGCIG